jgi:urease accessory protein
MHDSLQWCDRIKSAKEVEYLYLDQWMAQKSRFVARGDKGGEYAIALHRHSQVKDGDVVYYSAEQSRGVVLRLNLNPVMVIDIHRMVKCDMTLSENIDMMVRLCVELGHALGNQHWPAVVKSHRVYVPLTVDKRVMASVMDTHNFDNVTYHFEAATEVIPYLSPHEIRFLFGAANHPSHSHSH